MPRPARPCAERRWAVTVITRSFFGDGPPNPGRPAKPDNCPMSLDNSPGARGAQEGADPTAGPALQVAFLPEVSRHDEGPHVIADPVGVPAGPGQQVPHLIRCAIPACSAIVQQFVRGNGASRPSTDPRARRRGSTRRNCHEVLCWPLYLPVA